MFGKLVQGVNSCSECVHIYHKSLHPKQTHVSQLEDFLVLNLGNAFHLEELRLLKEILVDLGQNEYSFITPLLVINSVENVFANVDEIFIKGSDQALYLEFGQSVSVLGEELFEEFEEDRDNGRYFLGVLLFGGVDLPVIPNVFGYYY